MSELFWLEEPQESLRRARASGRFPQAILVHAAAGCGGEELAVFAAQAALCREPAAPCLHCTSCQRVAARGHADLYWVQPVEESKQVRVDQIRALNESLAMTSHEGGAAVAIIAPAETMNESTANALLKSLEEPRAAVTVVLVTAAPALLRPTIRSRCLQLPVRTPPRAESVRWLEAQRGPGPWAEVLEVHADAPLAALRSDPKEIAALRADTRATLQAIVAGSRAPGNAAAAWPREAQFPLRLRCTEQWLTEQIANAVALPANRHLSEHGAMPKIGQLLRAAAQLQELWRLLDTPVNKVLGLEVVLWQLASLRGA